MTKEEILINHIQEYLDSGMWQYESCDLRKEDLETIVEVLKAESCEDCISRQGAINALWQALYKYEDETEKQFQDSDELDVSEWIIHRIFVQNMSDADRQAILDLPSVQPIRPKRQVG